MSSVGTARWARAASGSVMIAAARGLTDEGIDLLAGCYEGLGRQPAR